MSNSAWEPKMLVMISTLGGVGPGLDIRDILKAMAKVLVSMDDKLLARLDRAARRLGLSRSAYLTRLITRDLGEDSGPGRDPAVRKALAAIDRLFAENPSPGDPAEIIRKMRDSR